MDQVLWKGNTFLGMFVIITKKEIDEISNIVEMGYKTAREYSDSEVARVYIKNITQ